MTTQFEKDLIKLLRASDKTGKATDFTEAYCDYITLYKEFIEKYGDKK